MVHLVLPSLQLAIDAGHSSVLGKPATETFSVDANIVCTHFPTEPTYNNNLLSLLRTIEFRNLNRTSQVPYDSIIFRISTTNYTRCVNYLNSIYTPSWARTNATDVDSTNNAIIRTREDSAGNTFAQNDFLLTVDEVATAPGNFHTSTHGCFADLHIGYIASCLTNAHEGRAVIINENTIFDTFHNGNTVDFGTAFLSALFPTVPDGEYYTASSTESPHLLVLIQSIYHDAPGRMQESTLNDTEEYQTVPLEAEDTISIHLTINGSLQMGTSTLAQMDEIQIRNILSNISSNAQVVSGDPQYAQPLPPNISGYEYSTVNQTIAIQLRSQLYKLVLTMPSSPTLPPIQVVYQRITNIGRDHKENEEVPPGTNYFAELYHSFGHLRWEYPSESQYVDNLAQFSSYTPETHDIIVFKYNDTKDNPNRIAEPLYRIESWNYRDDRDDDGILLDIHLGANIFDFTTMTYQSITGNTLKANAQAAGATAYGDVPGEEIASQVYLYQGIVSNQKRSAWDSGMPPNAKLFGSVEDDTAVQVVVSYNTNGTEVEEISRLSGRNINDLFTNIPVP